MKRCNCINCSKPNNNGFDKHKIDSCEVVCNEICGNLLLDDSIPNLEIWRKKIVENFIINISVFNSAINVSSIRVLINDNKENRTEFTVPPGNTMSIMLDNVESIEVIRIGKGKAEGKYCLGLCFQIKCKEVEVTDCKKHKKIKENVYTTSSKYKSKKTKRCKQIRKIK
ncbi:S-Ena type endospore appendage [Priestia sp. TSO9]|uniref:S-Ena type endospore appendage n=1 Tax=Priestia sp. TSO9 TaxID=2885632 RepID=UPI001E600F9F|nr:S-Ena type endospore appendage [Priestia sp. TSO9]